MEIEEGVIRRDRGPSRITPSEMSIILHMIPKLLKQRYGQNYKIATAYVDKVTKGPAIKSEDRK